MIESAETGKAQETQAVRAGGTSLRKVLRGLPLSRMLHAQSYTLRYLWASAAPGTSYAQAGEDLIIARLLGRVNFFIDIGANDGISGSNTFYFALRGARGVCFEPVPDMFCRLKALYRLTRGVTCRKVGISDSNHEGTIMAADFLSFLPETEDAIHTGVVSCGFHVPPKPERISLRRFETAIEGLAVPPVVDLLSIDIEGHELSALRSIPFEWFKFRAIIVETHLYEESTKCYKWRHRDLAEIEALLQQHGYVQRESTWVNTIYLPQC